ncbi:hypothetical protein LA03_20675 [Burkholderia gladioli]|uniref:hypothetical protein n=1 Tax=Burkholderia gladioli TaxID=28095 RepID=UPI00050F3E84|nr:hypothetical protein [Burkholderia gladioli]KGE08552.1 hypothetical protein LA03_20675 [Burkholderia gladioli]
MANELTLNGAERSIDCEVGNMLNLAAKLETLGVRKATTESGVYYERDVNSGITVIATCGVRVTKGRAVLNITLPLPGASPDDVLAELQPATQEQRGAVLGHSQQWVSERESK